MVKKNSTHDLEKLLVITGLGEWVVYPCFAGEETEAQKGQ